MASLLRHIRNVLYSVIALLFSTTVQADPSGLLAAHPHEIPGWVIWAVSIVSLLLLVFIVNLIFLKRLVSNKTAALAQANARYRRLLENSNSVPWEADPDDFRMTYIGPQVVGLLGYPIHDWYNGDFWVDHLHPDDRQWVVDYCRQETSKRRDHVMEYRMLRLDGSVVWVRDVINLTYNEKNQLRMQGFLFDITERKVAEHQFYKQSQFVNTVLDNIADGIVACDANGTLTLFNKSLERIHGIPIADISPEQWGEYYDLYLADGVTPMALEQNPLYRALVDGEVNDIEMVIAPKTGPRKVVISNGRCLYDDQGEKLGAVATVHDITEQKNAEWARRDTEAKLTAHLRHTPLAVIEWDTQMRAVSWNPAAEKIFGYTEEQALGRSAYELIVPQDVIPHVEGVIKSLLNARGGQLNVNENITRSGGRIICEWHNTTLQNSQGAVIGIASIAQDVTDSKRVDRVLHTLARDVDVRSADEFLRDCAIALYEVFQADYTFIAFIKADDPSYAETRALCHKGEAIENFAYELKGTPCEDVLKKDKQFITQDVGPKYPDDQLIDDMNLASYFGVPLTNSKGEIFGLVVATHSQPMPIKSWTESLMDVFARRIASECERFKALDELRDHRDRLEEIVASRTDDLRAAKEEAVKANLAKSEFLSRMSHELRTPMNAILGFAQLLEIEDLNPSQAASVEEILRAGGHLLDLINEVLDLARIEAGSMQMEIQSVSLPEVMEYCARLLEELASRHRVTLQLGTLSCKDVRVSADPMRLRQVLINLLTNAIKYNRVGGNVIVHCEVNDALHVRVKVTDTGMGLTHEQQAQLFTAFNRLGAERTNIEGTGIGLVITQNLVQLMDGNIGFDSVAGQGSTFWIDLPLAGKQVRGEPVSVVEKSADQGDGPAACAANMTVLTIEDNQANARLIDQLLQRRSGICHIIARTAYDGLDMARQYRPDLILLDINLPDLDGVAVAEALRAQQDTATVPIIAVTANAMIRKLKLQKNELFQDLIVKPFDIERFYEAIDKALIINEEDNQQAEQ